MSTVWVNGIDLYYEDRGNGTPILCIHGTGGSALQWEAAAAEYSKRGRCISYDRRGNFRSERPESYESTNMSEHTDDAAALLDVLSASPAVIIGRSYGGGIALDLALRFPDKVTALALLEPAVDTLAPEVIEWWRPQVERVLEAGQKDVMSAGEIFIRAVAGDGTWESFPDEAKEVFRANSPAILAELRGELVEFVPDTLAQIDQPALIVSSKDSPEPFRRPNEVLADILPNTETVLVAGGHIIDPTDPAIVNFVDRFVESPA